MPKNQLSLMQKGAIIYLERHGVPQEKIIAVYQIRDIHQIINDYWERWHQLQDMKPNFNETEAIEYAQMSQVVAIFDALEAIKQHSQLESILKKQDIGINQEDKI